jgi:hypothetical protein
MMVLIGAVEPYSVQELDFLSETMLAAFAAYFLASIRDITEDTGS